MFAWQKQTIFAASQTHNRQCKGQENSRRERGCKDIGEQRVHGRDAFGRYKQTPDEILSHEQLHNNDNDSVTWLWRQSDSHGKVCQKCHSCQEEKARFNYHLGHRQQAGERFASGLAVTLMGKDGRRAPFRAYDESRTWC